MAIQRTEDNIFIRYATAIAIGTITFLMIFATLFFWQQGKASQAAKEWVIHTYDVRGHIRLLFSGLKDADNGQRGYLLTGNKDYLEPYEETLRDSSQIQDNFSTESHRSIKQELATIRLLTRDNPVQQAFRYRATANITARLAF